MDKFSRVPLAIIAGSLFALLTPGLGHAAGPEKPAPAVQHELVTELETRPVEYRKRVKQAMESHLAAFGLILTLRAPHPENLQSHADALAWLAKAHEDLYPEGSESPGTRATIWQQREQFDAAARKTTAAAGRLQAAVKDGNRHLMLNSAVQLGESCENCHRQYREAGD